MTDTNLVRCSWCEGSELYIRYHDEEWGVPLHDDRKLFEFLILDGAQAGLSWLTILKRRDGYRRAFDNFDIAKVAGYDDKKVTELLNDPGIIRNRLKILSAVKNAQAVLAIQKEFGSFDKYLWQFSGGQPIQHSYHELRDIQPTNEAATAMSKDLRSRGCNFVGPTICYAFMQAAGLVNDHLASCFRHAQLVKGARGL